MLMLTQYSPCTNKQLVLYVLNYTFVIIIPLLKINLHIGKLHITHRFIVYFKSQDKKEMCEIRTRVVEVLYHVLVIYAWFRFGSIRH